MNNFSALSLLLSCTSCCPARVLHVLHIQFQSLPHTFSGALMNNFSFNLFASERKFASTRKSPRCSRHGFCQPTPHFPHSFFFLLTHLVGPWQQLHITRQKKKGKEIGGRTTNITTTTKKPRERAKKKTKRKITNQAPLSLSLETLASDTND
jgi:hypothetical protein